MYVTEYEDRYRDPRVYDSGIYKRSISTSSINSKKSHSPDDRDQRGGSLIGSVFRSGSGMRVIDKATEISEYDRTLMQPKPDLKIQV